MRGTVLYCPRDVRFEDREVPRIEKPTDVIIRIAATGVRGSDLWPYRGIQKVAQPTPIPAVAATENQATAPAQRKNDERGEHRSDCAAGVASYLK